MNLLTGIAMLAVATILIVVGLPRADGMHRKLLRFNAALVIYPPLVLVFIAFGVAAVISSF